MDRSHQRAGHRLLALATALVGWLGLALPAAALPVDVFFEGPSVPGDPLTSYGLGQTQAEAVELSHGVTILRGIAQIGVITGMLEASPSFAPTFGPDALTSTPTRASSTWTVDNVSGGDFSGATYLLFTHTDPFTRDGVLVDYADANVGLTIDEELGWVIIEAVHPTLGAFYYPAILLDRGTENPLDGLLAAGATSSPFSIEYVVKQALVAAPLGGTQYQLPELQLGMAFQPVPEPATAALLGLGLLALAARRARSC